MAAKTVCALSTGLL